MRQLLLADLFLFIIAAFPVADPAPAPTPTVPSIVFPKKTKPDTVPAPLPDAPYVLAGDALYVIDCKVDCFLRVHPGRLVKVKKLKGPRDFYAKFTDGSGQLEDRSFAGPCIFVVTAAGTGTVELDVIPVGAKDENEIQTATIQVDSGQGPQPPPKPVDPPKPPEPGPVTSFHVIYVYESSNILTAAQNTVLYGKTVSDYLNAKTTKDGQFAGWRRYDKDVITTNESPVIKALWDAVKPKITTTPCLVIETNGKADILPLPATTDEALALLKKYGGN